MTVGELIEKLREFEPNVEVMRAWDGAARSNVETVWLARGGYVVLAGYNDVIYHTEDRPPDAPTEEGETYWYTPDAPSEEATIKLTCRPTLANR